MSKYIKCTLITAFLIGCATIIIAANQAARVGDHHTCPQFTFPNFHVGGPILTGSPTVIICGSPAATVGSLASCVGPTDIISQGSATVLINGQPAARRGDGSAHGGVIVAGCPTVLIGP